MNAKQLLESRKRGLLDKTDVVNLSDALLAVEIAKLETAINIYKSQDKLFITDRYETELKELKLKNGITD